jgi:chromosome segregation ATPase
MMAEIADLNHKIQELQDNLDIEKSNFRELREANASFVADLKSKTDLIKKLELENRRLKGNPAENGHAQPESRNEDLEQQLLNCKKEIQRLARENKDLRDEIENNMQPKTLTLVFDDAVNDLACI